MELYLSHNPYTIETVFKINDKHCDASWFKELTMQNGTQTRLQMWIMRFFDKLHEAYPKTETFSLKFKGTSTDCDDIQTEANAASERLGIPIFVQFAPCGDPENKFEQLKDLYKEAAEGPYDGFHNITLDDSFTKIEDRELSVSVMAPMKNGKSTLLNAILGQEILPNATQRCTAKISYIEHCADADGFEAKKIEDNQNPSDYIPCTQQILQEWNSDDSVKYVKIRGEFPGIDITNYRLQFVDTPGPDSAVHKEDQTTIERFLNDNTLPMVCYIIDRVNASEVHYLERLKNHMSKYGKQSEDRFIFVISRMDQLNISKSDSKDNNPIKTKVEDIRNDLKKLGINNPRIFPVSAWLALQAREYGKMDEDDQDEAVDSFKKFKRAMRRVDSTLMDYMSLSPRIKSKLTAELSDLTKKFDLEEDTEADNLRYAEILSGIPALEMAIEEYLLKYSVPARIYDAATVFEEGISKANAERALLNDIKSKKTSLKEIETRIERLRDLLVNGKDAKKIQDEMFPEKWKESKTLKNELSTYERDFDLQIREEIVTWIPETMDNKGTISPDEAEKHIKSFVEFMAKLSNTMLGVYSNAVEDDAKRQFNDLKIVYEEKIQEILGQMPEDLRGFLNRIDFVLRINSGFNVKMEELIIERTEEYIEQIQREITVEKDGMWKAFVSILPFTDTATTEDIARTRTIKRVSFNELKSSVKEEASNILQTGLSTAEKAAAGQYACLRKMMLKEFARMDEALKNFNSELQKKLFTQKEEDKKLAEHEKVLEWVKNFQDRLKHILDLED